MNLLHQYIEISEGEAPLSVHFDCSQNDKTGSVYKLYIVKMPNGKTEYYAEFLEKNCVYVAKADIRLLLDIFGPEKTEQFYSKAEIEEFLKLEE